MAEKITKLRDKLYEIKTELVREEIVTVDLDVLTENIRTAEEAVGRREGELASAIARRDELVALKDKLLKVK